MENISLIIFDCDGTLTDSEMVNNQALLDVLREEGITQYDLDYAYANWVGKTVSTINLMIQMETGKTLSPDVVQRYIARVAVLQQSSLKPIKDAASLVASAKEKYKICVASNGERSNVIQSLVMTGLMPYFHEDHIFSKIQVRNPKPYPDLFLFAAHNMGVSPEACLVIEDSATGVTAGVSAGMTTWGFTGSAHNPQKQAVTLKQAGAHEVFDALIHIREKLVA